MRADKFYEDHSINLRISEKISEIDPKSKTVNTDKGETTEYQDLILATGSRPRKLKWHSWDPHKNFDRKPG